MKFRRISIGFGTILSIIIAYFIYFYIAIIAIILGVFLVSILIFIFVFLFLNRRMKFIKTKKIKNYIDAEYEIKE